MRVIRPTLVSFALLTIVTGVIYPMIVTGIARLAFADRAQGSIISVGGKAVGSSLIAQSFTDAKYFWSRPSAANYDATAGSGSNLGPNNPALVDAVKARVAALRAADPGNSALVPVDLVTASGSGLDPHISVEAATYQAGRVARSRHIDRSQVDSLIEKYTEQPALGILGPARVNVMSLNLELDGSVGSASQASAVR